MTWCSSRKLLIALFLACLCWLLPVLVAQASVHVVAKRVAMPGMTLNQVEATLKAAAKGPLQVDIRVAGVDLAAAGWHGVSLRFSGQASRLDNLAWQLDGTLQLHGAPGGVLSNSTIQVVMDMLGNNLDLGIAQGSARVDAALPLDQLTHARLRLHRLPLVWLQGLVAQAWSGKLTGGRMSGTVALDVGDEGMRASGDISIAKAGFDSADGKLAGAELDLSGRVTLDTTGEHGLQTRIDIDLDGGQLLLGSLYAVLPEHPVHLLLNTHAQAHGTAIPQLRFTDPDALQLVGSMVLSPDGQVRNLHFTQAQVLLEPTYQRYAKAWLASMGLAKLRVTGSVDGGLWMDSHGLRAFHFNAHQVDVDGDRLAAHGLDGGVDWAREGTRDATTLSWQGLEFYRVAFGPAQGRWQSLDANLTLLAPLNIPVLGGQVHLQKLAWNPVGGDEQRLQTALAITGVDVASLCEALGWPKFSGTLAGAIPGLSYVGHRIDLDGGINLQVFGGFVNVTSLSLEHPFGDVPVLAGDVHMHKLNLANLTGVFDFGRITGSLSGSVENLRMVDWKPVAFDARLLTDGKGRISQRAVHNLTSMGGGGMASGLQGAVMSLFDSFGYQRIGLHCVLEGSVCHMSGLEPTNGGYLIVEGRGLPHLSVVGHQKDVSWPVLIARLQAAIKGGGPVIQ